MLAILTLIATASATDIVYANIYGTEPDADGTCSPWLGVLADGDLHVFEDDGQPVGLDNYAYYLDIDFAPGCAPINGLPLSDQCGPERTYQDGQALWRISMGEVDEGDFGTLLVTNSGGGGFDELPIVEELPWSCGACVLAADINGDGVVTITDYLDLLTALGTFVSAGDPRDIDGDGFVGGPDLVEVVHSLGDECPEGL